MNLSHEQKQLLDKLQNMPRLCFTWTEKSRNSRNDSKES